MVWWLLRVPYWFDKGSIKENPWPCICYSAQLANTSCGNLNNRPLTYVCSDLNEPQSLMPSHLLYARMINTLPHSIVEHDELTDDDYCTGHTCMLHHNLTKKAKAQVMLLRHFWNHWKGGYLTSLRETHTANGTNIETI